MMSRLLASILGLFLLAGCVGTTPPVTFIQLSADGVAPGTAAAPRVMVDSIEVPDYLLRNELLRRVDEHQLRYDTTARWAEPLDLGVQRVLTHRLAAELDSAAVKSFPSGGSTDVDWRVDVGIRNFEAEGSNVRVLADVRLFHNSGGQDDPASWQFAALRPLPGDTPADIAAALSALLAELVTDIAARMQTSP